MEKRSIYACLWVVPGKMAMFVSIAPSTSISQVVVFVSAIMRKWNYMLNIEQISREILGGMAVFAQEVRTGRKEKPL